MAHDRAFWLSSWSNEIATRILLLPSSEEVIICICYVVSLQQRLEYLRTQWFYTLEEEQNVILSWGDSKKKRVVSRLIKSVEKGWSFHEIIISCVYESWRRSIKRNKPNDILIKLNLFIFWIKAEKLKQNWKPKGRGGRYICNLHIDILFGSAVEPVNPKPI